MEGDVHWILEGLIGWFLEVGFGSLEQGVSVQESLGWTNGFL